MLPSSKICGSPRLKPMVEDVQYGIALATSDEVDSIRQNGGVEHGLRGNGGPMLGAIRRNRRYSHGRRRIFERSVSLLRPNQLISDAWIWRGTVTGKSHLAAKDGDAV